MSIIDPVNRPPDEGLPSSGPQLSDRQRAIVGRKNCNALLDTIQSDRSGLPWFENTPIIYRFSDSVVRDRLMKVMKSEIVRLMDRNYMITLNERLIEAHQDVINKRIEARRKWEIEREKQLVFDGKLSLSDGPPGLAKHSFFREDNMVKKRMAIEFAKRRLRKVKKVFVPLFQQTFDYEDAIEGDHMMRDGDASSGDESGLKADKGECMERNFLQAQIEREADGRITDPPGYHEEHYEAIGVKQIKRALTVEKMFEIADRIFLKL